MQIIYSYLDNDSSDKANDLLEALHTLQPQRPFHNSHIKCPHLIQTSLSVFATCTVILLPSITVQIFHIQPR